MSIIGAVGMCMLANIISNILLSYLEESGATITESPSLMVNTPTSFLLNLVVIAVLPALLEEMVYRGYILRVLRPYGSFYAVLISSLLFSLMHQNLRQIPFAFIVGMVLGFLYVQTNNILVPMIIHFINNGISVTMQYLSFSLTEEQVNLLYMVVTYGLIIIGGVAAFIVARVFRNKLRLPRRCSSLGFFRRIGISFSTPLFLIAVLMYVIFLLTGM